MRRSALVLTTLTYPSRALTLVRTSPFPSPGPHTLALATGRGGQRRRDDRNLAIATASP